jgi:2-hydroxycyclohexanecarboxyl-CoA dehydrogenase
MDLRGLTGKTAIVTGGAQGIGRAITLRLAEEGRKVAIFDLKPEVAREAAREAGPGARVYAVDIADRAAVDAAPAVCAGMAARGAGRVVTIASDAARVGTSGEAVYSACKGGMVAFTKSMARELARNGVLLNAICPGPTNMPMMHKVMGSGEQAVKWQEAMVRGIPLRRMGEPHDYAGIVAFLVPDDDGYITGQTISVSGGMNMI